MKEEGGYLKVLDEGSAGDPLIVGSMVGILCVNFEGNLFVELEGVGEVLQFVPVQLGARLHFPHPNRVTVPLDLLQQVFCHKFAEDLIGGMVDILGGLVEVERVGHGNDPLYAIAVVEGGDVPDTGTGAEGGPGQVEIGLRVFLEQNLENIVQILCIFACIEYFGGDLRNSDAPGIEHYRPETVLGELVNLGPDQQT